ncbi:MAG: metal-dependent transcriptional regulator [Syntrophobacteraceae bacterium]|nr:metal-dependent transcriptional regulator [Syntrophobacteraceae bacterium]
MKQTRQTKPRAVKRQRLSASLEDYIQVIFHLEESNRVARAKDIADQMGVQRPSVTGALKVLAARGLIHYSPYSCVTLTSEGRTIGLDFLHRHGILKEFFASTLQLDSERAELNAGRIEHAIDSIAVNRLIRFLEFLKSCPRTGVNWSEAFALFCEGGQRPSSCKECLKTCLDEIDQIQPKRAQA